MMDLKIISAGAGSGKTYRLTQEMTGLLASGAVRASGIIATTFTNKAAAELQERVRVRLLEEGLSKEANDLANALIGTVHGLGVKLLKRFAFEAGVSPEVAIIADEDQQFLFNQSLATVLTNERVAEMEGLSDRLGLNKSAFNTTDWRKVLKELTEVARSNNFSKETLETSKQRSFGSFSQFLDEKNDRSQEAWHAQLKAEMEDAIARLENNGDTTKVTDTGVKAIKELLHELKLRGSLHWHQWVKLAKITVGAKSRDDLAPLSQYAAGLLSNRHFHQDIEAFIHRLFDIALLAMQEYGRYKKSRGLIDYTDMEVLVNRLLDHPVVVESLKNEIDLLMVDEFQDTSPLQLEVFLKLSKLAKHSVWVGDPKQSIYGFRGAEPALMNAIIAKAGGLKKENILQHSWRSREDIVLATNAIFTKAFQEMPVEQVALLPKRCKKAAPGSANRSDEPDEVGNALVHWHFQYDGDGRKPGRSWLDGCIAEQISTLLQRRPMILPKGEKSYRPVRPGDIAILCRSNASCQDMAVALNRAGVRSAISRAGLLDTAEAKLVLACLKFILNKYDSLSIAEILILASARNLDEVVENRVAFLRAQSAVGSPQSAVGSRQSAVGSWQSAADDSGSVQDDQSRVGTPEPAVSDRGTGHRWGDDDPFIQQLNRLRQQVVELSSAELLTLLLEEMELRRIITAWGNTDQRLANVDVLIKWSYQYEDNCNRLHTAASLGGFLLWLNELENNAQDMQGASENPLAVNVLTYHKSKGLEYPVVICHSLDQPLREEVWGLAIVPESPQVDLDNLLANRWLRYWVNPFADQYRNTVLEERIDASPAKAQKRREALEEEARLLYVGLTRARDYLVVPTYHAPPAWLNRVYFEGKDDQPVLTPDASMTPLEWDGQPIGFELETRHFPADFGYSDIPEPDHFLLSLPDGKRPHPPYLYDESTGDQAFHLREISCSTAVELPEVIERQWAGKAVTAFLSAQRTGMDEASHLALAAQVLRLHRAADLLAPERVLAVGRDFDHWLAASFPKNSRHAPYPVRACWGGQYFETQIDLLLKTPDGGWQAIFHHPFVGETKARMKKAKELSGKMYAVKRALGEINGGAPVGLFLHFVLSGVVVKYE